MLAQFRPQSYLRLMQAKLSERDQAWLTGLRAGDAAAFETIFRFFFDNLYRLAYHDVRSQAVAEDILQDVFSGLWEQRNTISIHGSIEGYLVRAVRNRTLNYLRHSRVEDAHAQRVLAVQDIQRAGDVAPDIEAERRDFDNALAEAVTELPVRAREAYVLYHLNGLSYAEVAARMGISARGVETNLGVALRELRKQLQRFAPKSENSGAVPGREG